MPKIKKVTVTLEVKTAENLETLKNVIKDALDIEGVEVIQIQANVIQ